MKRNRHSEKGVALLVAVASAMIVFIMVMAVMNLAFNRFNLSFLQSDHAAAQYACEAGVRYVFMRMESDLTMSHTFAPDGAATTGGFAQVVRHARDHGTAHTLNRTYFVITSVTSGNVAVGGAPVAPDLRRNELFMGRLTPTRVGREVTIRVEARTGGASPEFFVRAFSDYGD